MANIFNNRPMVDFALNYLKSGKSVIPVGTSKVPLVAWQKYQQELPMEEEVKTWWTTWPDANVGIVTGKISNLTVVDVEKGGAIDLPDTLTIETGGGGKHYYFNYMAGVGNKTRILPLVDIRSEGGYVCAPPSLHASGQRYKILKEAPVVDFPIFALPSADSGRKWDEVTSGVSQGQRNDSAAGMIGKILRVHPEHEWESVCWPLFKGWNSKNTPPLSEKELRITFDSIAKRELSSKGRRERTGPSLEEKEKNVNFISYTELLERSIIDLDNTKPEDIISFGYDWLDDKLTGLFPGEMVIVGGETGTGKTVFCTNIIYKASSDHKCIVFALEDRLTDYGIKAIYFELGKVRKKYLGPEAKNYPWNSYRRNEITDPEYKCLREEAVENLKNGNIHFADIDVQMDIDLLEKLIKDKKEDGFDLFLIDHLHYFDLHRADLTKADYIEKVMVKLKTILNHTGIKLIMVVHYKKLQGKKPALDSFKDSISIVQNANYVINIWRNRNINADQYKTTFQIPKSRNPNGEGTIEVEFDPAISDYKKVENWWYGTEQEISNIAGGELWDSIPEEDGK